MDLNDLFNNDYDQLDPSNMLLFSPTKDNRFINQQLPLQPPPALPSTTPLFFFPYIDTGLPLSDTPFLKELTSSLWSKILDYLPINTKLNLRLASTKHNQLVQPTIWHEFCFELFIGAGVAGDHISFSKFYNHFASHDQSILESLIETCSKSVFVEACSKNHIVILRQLQHCLKNEIFSNLLTWNHCIGFRCAASMGNLEVLNLLYSWANDVERVKMIKLGPYAAFVRAATNGHLKVVQALASWVFGGVGGIQTYARLMIVSKDYEALRAALFNNHYEAALYIIELFIHIGDAELMTNMIRWENYLIFRKCYDLKVIQKLWDCIFESDDRINVLSADNGSLIKAAYKSSNYQILEQVKEWAESLSFDLSGIYLECISLKVQKPTTIANDYKILKLLFENTSNPSYKSKMTIMNNFLLFNYAAFVGDMEFLRVVFQFCVIKKELLGFGDFMVLRHVYSDMRYKEILVQLCNWIKIFFHHDEIDNTKLNISKSGFRIGYV